MSGELKITNNPDKNSAYAVDASFDNDLNDLQDLSQVQQLDSEVAELTRDRENISFDRLSEIINRIQMSLNHEQQKLYKSIGRSTEKLRKDQVNQLVQTYRDRTIYWVRIAGGVFNLVSAVNQMAPKAGYFTLSKLNQWGENVAKRLGVLTDKPLDSWNPVKLFVHSFVDLKPNKEGWVNGVWAGIGKPNMEPKFNLSYVLDYNPAGKVGEASAKAWGKVAEKTSGLITGVAKTIELYGQLLDNEMQAVRTPIESDREVLRRRKEDVDQEATQEGQRKDSALQQMKTARDRHHEALNGVTRGQ